jgi:SAM-dependent methyltransferase
MKNPGSLKALFIFLLFFFLPSVLLSQNIIRDTTFVPRVGQEGKDVIWVPTPYELVGKMLEVADVGPNDYVIDLGSGDGRTVIAAARLGARALGIEYNPEMVQISRKSAEEAGVSGRAVFIQADLFEYDLSQATVVTMFLLPEINLKLKPRLLDLKPGTRIVSNTFNLGNWEPDFEVTSDTTWSSWYTALMWIVPAKIEGSYKFAEGDLNIEQEFQLFYGSYTKGSEITLIKEGRINGFGITFVLNGEKYSGEMSSNGNLSGTVTSKNHKRDWIAVRIKSPKVQ